MKLALKMSIRFVVFVGEKELMSDKLSVKLMDSKKQIDMLSFSEVLYLVNNTITTANQQPQNSGGSGDSKIKII